MSIRLHNTLSRQKTEFVPVVPGKVGMYVCGVTQYDSAHIGHGRMIVVYGAIVGYLRRKGYEVTYVCNHTDVDDKIIDRAREKARDPMELAEFFINEYEQDVDAMRLAQATVGLPVDTFTLLLYHSPDLIAHAAEQQIDLYLGGHTHGGQLRLPFYGAMFTSSMYGKQYEAGLFEKGDTRMYISRGVGFEGGGMPRARFLCRPEIVSLELGGTS